MVRLLSLDYVKACTLGWRGSSLRWPDTKLELARIKELRAAAVM